MSLIPAEVARIVTLALAEDVGFGDVTSGAVIPPETTAKAVFRSKDSGILCGVPLLLEVYRQLDAGACVRPCLADGDPLAPGVAVAHIEGPARSMLTGERVALNFMQHLSGIATRTRRFVELVAGTEARIVDTRKTVPGLRALAKYAVRAGGGLNHRFGLYDGILIKDNHIALAGGVIEALTRMRSVGQDMVIEVEVRTLDELDAALTFGATRVLMDNMDVATLADAVRRATGRAQIEVSGGVTVDRVAAIAAAGVDFVSVGALTHSAASIDLSFKIAAAP